MHVSKSNLEWKRGLAFVGLVWAGLISHVAHAQDAARPKIDAVLDRIDPFVISGKPLAAALRELEQRTQIPFSIDGDVAELMPYGANSRITMNIPKIPLRSGLSQVFEGLGFRMDVLPDRIRVVPAPFLERMGRRISVEEQKVAYELARRGEFSLANSPVRVELHIDGETKAAEMLDQALKGSRAPNALQHLEQAVTSLRWFWRLDGRLIVVERQRSHFLRTLERSVDCNYTQKPADWVLTDILGQIKIPLVVQNNALQAAGAADRRMDLITSRPAVRLIELICGSIGVDFEVTDEGLVVRPGSGAPRPPGANAQTTQLAAPQVVPAEEMVELLIEIRSGVWTAVRMPRSRIPADLREALEKRMKEIFGENPPALGKSNP